MARAPSESDVLHDRLRAAIERNVIQVYTEYAVLKQPTSPVFNPWEAVGPLLLLLMLALAALLGVGIIAGTVALIFCVLLYFVALGPWQEYRCHQRTVVFVLSSATNLDVLWSYGGVVLAMTDRPAMQVQAPKGNWRHFVKRTLPQADLTPLDTELAGAAKMFASEGRVAGRRAGDAQGSAETGEQTS